MIKFMLMGGELVCFEVFLIEVFECVIVCLDVIEMIFINLMEFNYFCFKQWEMMWKKDFFIVGFMDDGDFLLLLIILGLMLLLMNLFLVVVFSFGVYGFELQGNVFVFMDWSFVFFLQMVDEFLLMFGYGFFVGLEGNSLDVFDLVWFGMWLG